MNTPSEIIIPAIIAILIGIVLVLLGRMFLSALRATIRQRRASRSPLADILRQKPELSDRVREKHASLMAELEEREERERRLLQSLETCDDKALAAMIRNKGICLREVRETIRDEALARVLTKP